MKRSDKLAWKGIETIGIGVINPRPCWKVSGTPEQMREFLKHIRDTDPDSLTQEQIDEIDGWDKE